MCEKCSENRSLLTFSMAEGRKTVMNHFDDLCLFYHTNGSVGRGLIISNSDRRKVLSELDSLGVSFTLIDLSDKARCILKHDYDVPNTMTAAVSLLMKTKLSYWIENNKTICFAAEDVGTVCELFDKNRIQYYPLQMPITSS